MLRKVIYLVAVFAAGLAATAGAQEFTSPGPLASAHAEFDRNCGKCHSEIKGATDDKCLSCHKKVKDSKFHSQQANESKKTCADCHRDHRGRDFAMLRWTPPKDFDHGRTAFALRSAHALQPCKACHKVPQHWMGQKSACSDCHQDQHKPSLGPKCETCHTEAHFAAAEKFDHNTARFKLVGKHPKVLCQKCHESTGIRGKFRGVAFAACADCHREPKQGHALGRNCSECHGSDNWRDVSKGAALELHARTRLPLLGQHAEIPCEKCHKPAAGVPLGAQQPEFNPLDPTCAACHKDPHERRFGQECKKCHGFMDFRLMAGAVWSHDSTRFALQGLHKKVACASCHPAAPSYAKKYQSRDGNTCLDCHKDPHGGPFKSVSKGDRCETCHSVHGFSPADYGVEQHGAAKFPLEGSHRVSGCAACHPGGKEPGSVPKIRDVATTCAGCHKDVHGGQFMRDGALRACDQCHDNQLFVPAPRFDHDKTRFALTGGHKKPACTACHRRPTADAPVQFAAEPLTCESCHRDRHGGQFIVSEPVRTCQDCHTPAETLKIKQFDHARTRLPLDGRHAQVACSKCHPDRPRPDDKPTAFYRTGQLACQQCHKNPHVPHGSAGRGAP